MQHWLGERLIAIDNIEEFNKREGFDAKDINDLHNVENVEVYLTWQELEDDMLEEFQNKFGKISEETRHYINVDIERYIYDLICDGSITIYEIPDNDGYNYILVNKEKQQIINTICIDLKHLKEAQKRNLDALNVIISRIQQLTKK